MHQLITALISNSGFRADILTAIIFGMALILGSFVWVVYLITARK